MPRFWYVAATKYKQEKLADVELRKQGFETFLPRIRVHEEIGSGVRVRTRYVIRPYFPGYILVRFDKDRQRWQAINYTRGVARLFTCGELPTRIRRGVVERMKKEAVSGDFVIDDKMNEIVAEEFEVGQKVRIAAGPFEGFEGVVKMSSHEKISVLIDNSRFDTPIKMKPVDFAPASLKGA